MIRYLDRMIRRFNPKRFPGTLFYAICRGIHAVHVGLQSERFDVEHHWYMAARHGECTMEEAATRMKKPFTLYYRITVGFSYFWPAVRGKRDSRISLF